MIVMNKESSSSTTTPGTVKDLSPELTALPFTYDLLASLKPRHSADVL